MGQWKVYIHKFPNDKKYIGITKQEVEKRWENGEKYKNQVVYKAIKKYGWDNIKHEIVAEELTKNEACKIEQKLIAEYKTNQKEYGYNMTIGGETGRKKTYMCSDCVHFINEYYYKNKEAKKVFDWWKYICEDELEAEVFNGAYCFIDNMIKLIKKEEKCRIEGYVRIAAINTFLEAWQNNWTPECAIYNSIYVLKNYAEIISDVIFEKNKDWKKKITIKESLEYAENSPL